MKDEDYLRSDRGMELELELLRRHELAQAAADRAALKKLARER